MIRKLLKISILYFFSLPILAQVNADFKGNSLKGCKPLTVMFTDLSTGNPTNWVWDFGNGNTSSLQNPGCIYTTPGVYTVKLTASNSGSTDTETKVAYISVFDVPSAGFTFLPLTGCVGQSITFTDNSTLGSAPIKTWTWVYGDGNSQTVSTSSVSHNYGYGSTFPVSVIVTDTNGCLSNATNSITIDKAPVASFTASPTAACTGPLTVNFTNTSTTVGTATYTWDFGDASSSNAISPSHTYNTPGSYTVKLYINQGFCNDSIVKTAFVIIGNPSTKFSASDTTICLGDSIQFTNLTTPVSVIHNWDFGDASAASTNNAKHTYAAAGTYTVTLQTVDGGACTGTKTLVVTVLPFAKASFTVSGTGTCSPPFIANFTNTSTGASTYKWNFGDGNTSTLTSPTNTYTIIGSYSVTLIATNASGCSDTITIPAAASVGPPVADFISDRKGGCAPFTVNFSDNSNSPEAIVNYKWDFGNGLTSSSGSPNASSTYTATGTYTVKLVVTTSSGCKDSITKVNYISAGNKPVAKMGVVDSTMCYGINTNFIDQSTGTVTKYLWKFGDGSTDTIASPLHLYGDTGYFDVTLIVSDRGCVDSLVKKKWIQIFPPRPDFTYKVDCSNPFKVDFKDASVKADSVTWDFGDGTFDVNNDTVVSHVYGSLGPKDVIITAYNYTTGCSFFLKKTITITDAVANFTGTPLMGCYPLNVTFNNTSTGAVSYLWRFGNGDSSVLKNPSDVYQAPGKYNVKLYITDGNGCVDSLVRNKYVYARGPLPYFKADILKGCVPLNVNFTDTTIADTTLVSWSWDFGDSFTGNSFAPTISHTYSTAGSYNVTMTVTDKLGCTKTITKTKYINPTAPKPKFSGDTLTCRGKLANFNAKATTGVGLSYTWNFGDGTGTFPGVDSATHSYSNYGFYNVVLTVTDTNGCKDSIKKNILVHKPQALELDTALAVGCGFKTVQFTDNSLGFVNQWFWTFGNGASSQAQNPTYTYTSPGVYNVSLIVTSIAGCVDTLIADSLVTVPGPIGTFTFTPQFGCKPLKVNFGVNSNNSENYAWDFGDGNVIISVNSSLSHTYVQDITATPVVLMGSTLPNGNFCQLPATNLTGNVVVSTTTAVNINPPVVSLLDGDYIAVVPTTNISGPFVSSWSPSTNIDCPTCFNVFIQGGNKDMTYVLTVTDTAMGGCSATDTIKIIHVPCSDNFIIPNVFSPNYDGVNDVFKVSNVCPSYIFEMVIINRWGEVMYRNDVRNAGWDGKTMTNLDAPDGTYYYIVTIDHKPHTGTVTLIR